MAKTKDTPDEQETPSESPETPVQGNKVTAPAPTVYPFRVNGTTRVYDVDIYHLKTMANRSDLTYIGTIPLPRGILNNDVNI